MTTIDIDKAFAELTFEVGDTFGATLKRDLKSLAGGGLHQYTNVKGLLGILSSGAIWATNARFLNDRDELNMAYRVFERWLDTAAMSTVLRREVTQHVKILANGVSMYVACFSEEPDLLSQWRAYGDNGHGFSLGIDLAAVPDQSERGRSAFFRPVRVLYDKKEQDELARTLFDPVLKVYAEIGDDTAATRFCQRLAVHYLVLSVSCKADVFQEEREWRLAIMLGPDSDAAIKFRAGAFGLTPYLSMPLRSGTDLLPVRSITRGPQQLSPESKQALELLATRHGFEIDILHRSRASYR